MCCLPHGCSGPHFLVLVGMSVAKDSNAQERPQQCPLLLPLPLDLLSRLGQGNTEKAPRTAQILGVLQGLPWPQHVSAILSNAGSKAMLPRLYPLVQKALLQKQLI